MVLSLRPAPTLQAEFESKTLVTARLQLGAKTFTVKASLSVCIRLHNSGKVLVKLIRLPARLGAAGAGGGPRVLNIKVPLPTISRPGCVIAGEYVESGVWVGLGSTRYYAYTELPFAPTPLQV